MSAAEQLDYAQTTTYTATPKWIIEDGGVSFGAKACWAVLKGHDFSLKNVAFPSRKTVAEKLGVSTRTVTTYLRELKDAGMIVSRHRYVHNDDSGLWSFTQDADHKRRISDHFTLAWDGPLNSHLAIVPPIEVPLPYIVEVEIEDDDDLDAVEDSVPADCPAATEGVGKPASSPPWKEASTELNQSLSNETPNPPLTVSATSVESTQGAAPPGTPRVIHQQLQTKRARGENPRALGESKRQKDAVVVLAEKRRLDEIAKRERNAAAVESLRSMRPLFDSDCEYREYLVSQRSQGYIDDAEFDAAVAELAVVAHG